MPKISNNSYQSSRLKYEIAATKLNELIKNYYRYNKSTNSIEKLPIPFEMVHAVYEYMYEIDKSISKNITYSHFKTKVDKIIHDSIVRDEEITSEVIFKFISELKRQKEEIVIVETPLQGLTIESKRTTQIGPFTIKYYSEKSTKKFTTKSSGYYISVKIKNTTDDFDMIKSKAFAMFDDFISLITFMQALETNECPITIGIPFNKSSGIFTANGISIVLIYDTCGNNVMSSFELDTKVKISYNRKHFFDKNKGYHKIWSFYSQSIYHNTNDMQSRIVRAILEIGNAIRHRNIINSFVSLSIAYEALFTSDENSLTTPGVSHNIAERTSFLFSDSKIVRLETYKFVKDMYSLRSKVVHGKKAEVIYTIYHHSLHIIYCCINKLLTAKQIKNFKTYGDFTKWIEDKRFR